MAIQFYDYQPAPSPRRARMILAEKAIEHEVVQVDLATQEQLSEAFRKINPNCTVPALVLEDGTTLFENLGIALWAESEKPEPALLGKTPAERGLIASWMSKIDFSGALAFAETLRNSAPRMKDRALTGPRNFAQLPELAERGRVRIGDFLDDLNNQLDGQQFIASDEFSAADIWAFSIIGVTPWIKAQPTEEAHPHVVRWFNAVSDRPSAKL